MLGLCDDDDYLVVSLDADGGLLEGLLCPPPEGAKAAAMRALGLLDASASSPVVVGQEASTLCRGVPPHRRARATLRVRRGCLAAAPLPRLTSDTLQELYNHVLYAAQGRGSACIDCLEQLAAEASRWLGVVASSPADLANAARRGSVVVEGMRLVTERAMEGDRYWPPTPAGGFFRGGVAACIDAGIKGSAKQLTEMGLGLGHVVGRHCEEGRRIATRYMDGAMAYDDFVLNQQKAIRSELEGKSSISEVGYTVKKLLFEYLSLVAGHRGEVYFLAGKGRRRMVQRHFGGDGLDATKLVVEEPLQARTAVRLGVAVEIARRWIPRRLSRARAPTTSGGATATASAPSGGGGGGLCRGAPAPGQAPGGALGAGAEAAAEVAPPWRLDAVWAAVEEAAAGSRRRRAGSASPASSPAL